MVEKSKEQSDFRGIEDFTAAELEIRIKDNESKIGVLRDNLEETRRAEHLKGSALVEGLGLIIRHMELAELEQSQLLAEFGKRTGKAYGSKGDDNGEEDDEFDDGVDYGVND